MSPVKLKFRSCTARCRLRTVARGGWRLAMHQHTRWNTDVYQRSYHILIWIWISHNYYTSTTMLILNIFLLQKMFTERSFLARNLTPSRNDQWFAWILTETGREKLTLYGFAAYIFSGITVWSAIWCKQLIYIDKIVNSFSAFGDSRLIVLNQGLSVKTEDRECMDECCAVHTV